MSKKFDVAILGHGIVAHTLALLLAQDRLKVALVGPSSDAAQPVTPDIRAYSLNPEARALLDGLRVWPEGDAVTPMRGMWVCDTAPTPGSMGASFQLNATDAGADCLAWMIDVPALEAKLAQAVAFQPAITPCTEAPRATLTVVCEGKFSATRQQKGLPWDRRPYPQTAVAARFGTSKPHGGIARQWFLNGDIVALLPLGGEAGHEVALVWSCDPTHAQSLLTTPEQLAAEVMRVTDRALGEMTLQGQPAGWPLERSTAERWVQPGLALCGDAAHAMHPLAGQGLNVGLADAAELAKTLRDREYWRDLSDMRLLRRYERARKADVALMSHATDLLYGVFGHTDSRLQSLRQWGVRNFDRLSPLKRWVAQQAMGRSQPI